MNASTTSGAGTTKCCEYIVHSFQYLLATALVLTYFLFLPTIPYFALFSDTFAYTQVGCINGNRFHCAPDYIEIEMMSKPSNISTYYIHSNHTNANLFQNRSDVIYWDIFLVLCVISSIFGYWMILLCPAFKICVKFASYNIQYKLSNLDCSWKVWIINSTISGLFVISALVLALEKSCKDEVIQLYEEYDPNTDITITDVHFGMCLWYLMILITFNIMIACLCMCARNDEDVGYRRAFEPIITRKHKEQTYRCSVCKDVGFVTKCCVFKKTKCPMCNPWEELDNF